jgi:hypothetical protein
MFHSAQDFPNFLTLQFKPLSELFNVDLLHSCFPQVVPTQKLRADLGAL